MKKCNNCGFELNDEDVFCVNCGNKINTGLEKKTENRMNSVGDNRQIWIWRIVSGVLLLGCIFFALSFSQAEKDYDEIYSMYMTSLNKLDALEKESVDTEDDVDLSAELAAAKADYDKLYRDYIEVFSQCGKYEAQVEFMNNYVVIIENCSWPSYELYPSWSKIVYNQILNL